VCCVVLCAPVCACAPQQHPMKAWDFPPLPPPLVDCKGGVWPGSRCLCDLDGVPGRLVHQHEQAAGGQADHQGHVHWLALGFFLLLLVSVRSGSVELACMLACRRHGEQHVHPQDAAGLPRTAGPSRGRCDAAQPKEFHRHGARVRACTLFEQV